MEPGLPGKSPGGHPRVKDTKNRRSQALYLPLFPPVPDLNKLRAYLEVLL
jgi:hypothetical protein